jgi:ABC-type Zn uptake system ZnuABC Zn-binding protein ZnuA
MIARADLFLTNGLALDSKCKEMATMSGSKSLRLVTLGAKLPDTLLIETGEDHAPRHREKPDEHKGHAHEHTGHDPHIWMGLVQAEKMVEGICDELKTNDPSHAANYDRRAAEYVRKLRALKTEGETLFKGKKDRKFLTFHESLGYFARTFDLTIAGVIEDVPGAEPSPKQRQDLVNRCVEGKVRVIAVEPQYSKAAAESIVRELKARGIEDPQIVRLDPMETATADEMNPGWYEVRMRENLKALADALR